MKKKASKPNHRRTLPEPARVEGNPPIRLGIWAADGDNVHFLNPVLDLLPERYRIIRFSWNPRTSPQEMQKQVRQVDMAWFEWATGPVIPGSKLVQGIPSVCRLHRYEAYTGAPREVNWKNIDRLIFINSGVIGTFEQIHPDVLPGSCKTEVIPNGIALDAYPFRPDKKRTRDLAFLGRVHLIKNPMLLVQIIRKLIDLDSEYVLHIGGPIHHFEALQYIRYHAEQMGIQENIRIHGEIPKATVAEWLSGFTYLVSSSVIESQGVGVVEGMALGLRPVIHDFVGARTLFPADFIYNAIDEAVDQIHRGAFEPERYRKYVEERFALDTQVAKIIRLLDRLASEYYPERMAALLRPTVPSDLQITPGEVDAAMEEANALIQADDLQAASGLIERLPFDCLTPEQALAPRLLALQLALAASDITSALYHADAALDLAADEPLVRHLAGRALWSAGRYEAAVDALVYAAELLETAGQTGREPKLPADPASIYASAAEACEHIGHAGVALRFRAEAARYAPPNEVQPASVFA